MAAGRAATCATAPRRQKSEMSCTCRQLSRAPRTRDCATTREFAPRCPKPSRRHALVVGYRLETSTTTTPRCCLRSAVRWISGQPMSKQRVVRVCRNCLQAWKMRPQAGWELQRRKQVPMSERCCGLDERASVSLALANCRSAEWHRAAKVCQCGHFMRRSAWKFAATGRGFKYVERKRSWQMT